MLEEANCWPHILGINLIFTKKKVSLGSAWFKVFKDRISMLHPCQPHRLWPLSSCVCCAADIWWLHFRNGEEISNNIFSSQFFSCSKCWYSWTSLVVLGTNTSTVWYCIGFFLSLSVLHSHIFISFSNSLINLQAVSCVLFCEEINSKCLM